MTRWLSYPAYIFRIEEIYDNSASKNGFGKQGSAPLRRRWLARAQKRNQAERERTEPRRADGTALSAEKRAVAERVKRQWLADETAGPQPCGGGTRKKRLHGTRLL